MIVDDDLIAKFLSGEADPEEAMALDDWLRIPANKSRFEEMVATWNNANPSKQLRAPDKQSAWRKVGPAKSIVWWPIGVAASVLLVVAYWLLYPEKQVETLQVTAINNIDTVKLSDQSVITLNKNSSIEYPKEFAKDSRKVNLVSGEAFFSVAKDARKPFIVHTGFSDITVVGTEFNVQTTDDIVEVGVREGVVLVRRDADSVYVRKGATMIFRKQGKAAPKDNDPNTWAYATHKLVFTDTPMEDVIKAVEKTYGVTITVSNDNIKKCTLNTTFDQYSVDKI
jgi:ferric-dicitrate binding protein FerR (iron transport regulator)